MMKKMSQVKSSSLYKRNFNIFYTIQLILDGFLIC